MNAARSKRIIRCTKLHNRIVLNLLNSHWGWCFQNPRKCWIMTSFVALFWVCRRWCWCGLHTLIWIWSFCKIIHFGAIDSVLQKQCLWMLVTGYSTNHLFLPKYMQYRIVNLPIPEISIFVHFLLSEDYRSMKWKMILLGARPLHHSSHNRLHLHFDLPKICFVSFLLRYFRQFYRFEDMIDYLSFWKVNW